jgi:hypothetical protein
MRGYLADEGFFANRVHWHEWWDERLSVTDHTFPQPEHTASLLRSTEWRVETKIGLVINLRYNCHLKRIITPNIMIILPYIVFQLNFIS